MPSMNAFLPIKEFYNYSSKQVVISYGYLLLLIIIIQQKENQEALITDLRRGKNLGAISCTNLVRQRSLTISDLFVDVVVFLVCLFGSELLLFLVS